MRKLVLVFALLVSVSAYAGTDPQMQEMMKLGAPGENHKALEAIAGHWKYELKYWMSADAASAEIMSGTNNNRWIMGGRFIQQEVKGKKDAHHKDMPPFQGLGFTGYDNIRKEYTSVWLDNMGTSIMTGSSQFDAAKQTFTESGTVACPMTGEKNRPYRGVLKVQDKNHYTYEMYMKDKSGKEFKSMEIAYTRTK